MTLLEIIQHDRGMPDTMQQFDEMTSNEARTASDKIGCYDTGLTNEIENARGPNSIS
jgi:hypothetical protein